MENPPQKSLADDTEKEMGKGHDVENGRSNVAEINFQDEDFMTRNGLNLNSFKCKVYGRGVVEMDRAMSTRHLHMIAIGGSIGAGFFVGSGGVLSSGGPASVLICYAIMGLMVFNVVYALGELAVMFPVSGGFYTYATRFIDPSWGFALGWNYSFQWCVTLPLELTVCAMVVKYWNADISPGVWITVFLFAIIVVNIFGSIGYAEEEFWAALLKMTAIVIFLIICLVLVLGGGPESGRYHEYWGARLWYDPGAFRNGFKGFCSVFVTAAFSFAGTELVGLSAAESKTPTKSVPGAIKQVFWRITLFYFLGMLFIGLLIPSTDPSLISSSSYADVKASPFVLVGKYAGLVGFDHFMNFVILVSALSIGVSGVYGGSRTITALGQLGYAPKWFTYIDRSGRPLASVALVLLFGPIAYVSLAAEGSEVFDWLLATAGLATLFTWGSICIAHIRFRKAWAHHGHTLDEIPFRAAGGVYGSYLGLVLVVVVFAAQLFTAIAPPGIGSELNDAKGFFKSCLALPVIVCLWVGGFLWKRTSWLKIEDMDVDSGRREFDWDYIRGQKAEIQSLPTWRRILAKFF